MVPLKRRRCSHGRLWASVGLSSEWRGREIVKRERGGRDSSSEYEGMVEIGSKVDEIAKFCMVQNGCGRFISDESPNKCVPQESSRWQACTRQEAWPGAWGAT